MNDSQKPFTAIAPPSNRGMVSTKPCAGVFKKVSAQPLNFMPRFARELAKNP